MKNRLSFTAITKYLECPKSYFFHYIAGLREEKVGSPLIFGNAIDKALNALLVPGEKDYKQVWKEEISKQKINGIEENLETSDKVKYSKSDVDLEVLDLETKKEYTKEQVEELLQKKTNNLLSKDDEKTLNRLSWQCLNAKGLMILEAYKNQIQPKIKRVIAVQKAISLSNGEDDFIGFIDLIAELQDGRIVIFDHKTTSIKYEDDSVKTSKQLATYVTAINKPNTYAGYIAIHKKILKKEPRVKIQFIVDKVDESVIDSTFEDYDKVNSLIKDGEFPRNWDACQRPWGKCSFFNLCKHGDYSGLVDKSKKKDIDE